MNRDPIAVSVICTTYNQEKYIRDALEGMLKQKADFKFEILVHDDASNDGTAEIVETFRRKYPELIFPIYQSENQYSKGINIGKEYLFPLVRGKYTAICEGDDFWTDPYKLQKQYNILERHPEIDMCAHGSKVISAATGKTIGFTRPAQEECVLGVEQFIHPHGMRVVDTATLFWRSSLNDYWPDFRLAMPMDTTLRICGALKGGIYYLPEVMSVYRWLSVGSWTSNLNKEKHIQLNKQRNTMLTLLDSETKGAYKEIIEMEKIETEADYLYSWGDCNQLKEKRYEDYVKSWTLPKKIILYIKQRLGEERSTQLKRLLKNVRNKQQRK